VSADRVEGGGTVAGLGHRVAASAQSASEALSEDLVVVDDQDRPVVVS
jgi:hypothetical protein